MTASEKKSSNHYIPITFELGESGTKRQAQDMSKFKGLKVGDRRGSGTALQFSKLKITHPLIKGLRHFFTIYITVFLNDLKEKYIMRTVIVSYVYLDINFF